MFLFLCTKLFQKWGHYSRGEFLKGGHDLRKYGNWLLAYVLSFFKKGDTSIQGGALFKGGHYLRKYGMYTI